MNVLLTSFGINQEVPSRLGEQESYGHFFFLMPPVSMRHVNNVFAPDYATLILCEKIVMDTTSFEALQEIHHWSYSVVAETLKVLYAEGFVQLVDCKQILKEKHALLERMIEHDLALLDQWVIPLKESIGIWKGFVNIASDILRQQKEPPMHISQLRGMGPKGPVGNTIFAISEADNPSGLMHGLSVSGITFEEWALAALKSSRLRRKSLYRDALRHIMHTYLSYVNANIVLANELDVGFHDWVDFLPFYRQKFLSVGRESPEWQQQADASQQLFEVSFPDLAITDPTALLKILEDKRVTDLRQLVSDAAAGKVTFDKDFAESVLKEVLGIEREIRKYQRVISYLTLPVDFLPWIGTFVQKASEEIAGMLVEEKLKQKYRWFYMLSDVIEESRKTRRPLARKG